MSLSFLPDRSEKSSFSQLLRELIAKVGELIATQIALTKAEIKLEGQKFLVALGLGLAAAVIGFTFVLFFGVSLTLLLARWLELAWAAMITSGVYLLLAALLAGAMMVEIRKKTERLDID
ncbi:phage holin family protein [Vampirovibrio sp.]|uniref:phage holin family protein n=1 Tax=Vampirovibrio sp. TaxID=2717857 RepID=UPI00359451B8